MAWLLAALSGTALGTITQLLSPAALERIPSHVAVIMDGSSRWARSRNVPRIAGHQAGVDALRTLIDGALELEVPCLTVYALSAENLRKRPPAELDWLFGLFESALDSDLERLCARGVQLRFLGDSDEQLPPTLRSRFRAAEARRPAEQKLLLCMAIAYGGRQSIAQAARDLAEQVHAGDLRPDEIDDRAFGAALSARSRGPPSDPDLLIRTGGEMRLSNFLLYESAYAELVCEDALWPDFGAETLAAAVEVYAARRRNFGGRAAHVEH